MNKNKIKHILNFIVNNLFIHLLIYLKRNLYKKKMIQCSNHGYLLQSNICDCNIG